MGFLGKRVPPWLVPVAGCVVSVACLLWAFHGVDLRYIVGRLSSMHWGWVSLAVASDIFVYVWQGCRWNLLLAPVVRAPLGRSVLAIYVGLFANEVLPLRPGEFVVRPYLQAHWSRIPFSVALSSIIIERIFDGVWLGFAFWATTVFLPLPGFLVQAGRLLGIVVLWMAMMLALIILSKPHAHAAVPKRRWGARFRVLIDDLHLMGRSHTFYLALAASLPYLLIQIVPVYALMRAYGLELSVWAATALLIILRLGTLVPQAPGNVGSFQALTVIVLGLFGINKTTAAGFSVMVWAVITLPLLVAGFLALTITGLRLGEIRRRAETAAATPAAVTAQAQPR